MNTLNPHIHGSHSTKWNMDVALFYHMEHHIKIITLMLWHLIKLFHKG